MKNVMLIVLCLMAIGSVAQTNNNKKVSDSIWNAGAQERHGKYIKDHAIEQARIAKITSDSKNENTINENKLKKKYGIDAYNKAIHGNLWVGMPDQLCIRAINTPNSVKKNYTSHGNTETWIYEGISPGCIGKCPYRDYAITFKNHKAISISDRVK